MTKRKNTTTSITEDLLRDLLIVQLALAGVPSHDIRRIAGVALARVTRVVKQIKKHRKHG